MGTYQSIGFGVAGLASQVRGERDLPATESLAIDSVRNARTGRWVRIEGTEDSFTTGSATMHAARGRGRL